MNLKRSKGFYIKTFTGSNKKHTLTRDSDKGESGALSGTRSDSLAQKLAKMRGFGAILALKPRIFAILLSCKLFRFVVFALAVYCNEKSFSILAVLYSFGRIPVYNATAKSN